MNTDEINVTPVPTLQLSSLVYGHDCRAGYYTLNSPWKTYAVVTELLDVMETRLPRRSHCVLELEIPANSVICISYDRRRVFGRRYRIRCSTAKIVKITNSNDEEMLETQVRRQTVKVGETYNFDFTKNPLFVVPSAAEIRKVVTYIQRYIKV